MTFGVFISAVLALLVAPGPTNTLMALAGAQGGLARAGRFIPAALFGYMAVVTPLACLGAEALATRPFLVVGIEVAAAAWVMVLAIRLWGLGGADVSSGAVTARRVFATTMLNPKGVIVGLVLLPSPLDAAFPVRLAVFAALVVAVSSGWGAGGALLRAGEHDRRRQLLIQRVSSVWLATLSVGLFAGAFAGT